MVKEVNQINIAISKKAKQNLEAYAKRYNIAQSEAIDKILVKLYD